MRTHVQFDPILQVRYYSTGFDGLSGRRASAAAPVCKPHSSLNALLTAMQQALCAARADTLDAMLRLVAAISD